MPDGKSFKIHKDGTQCKEDEIEIVRVLKRTFNQTRFKSFLRQLQLYGFERQFRGQHRGECRHVMFVRGQRNELLKKSIEDFQVAAMNSSTGGSNAFNAISSSDKEEECAVVTATTTDHPPSPQEPTRSISPVPVTTSLNSIRQVSLSSVDQATDESSDASSSHSSDDSVFPIAAVQHRSTNWTVPPSFTSCGGGPAFIESSSPSWSKGSFGKCQYMKTSVIPTTLRNLVLPKNSFDSSNTNEESGEERFPIPHSSADDEDDDDDELSLAFDWIPESIMELEGSLSRISFSSAQ